MSPGASGWNVSVTSLLRAPPWPSAGSLVGLALGPASVVVDPLAGYGAAAVSLPPRIAQKTLRRVWGESGEHLRPRSEVPDQRFTSLTERGPLGGDRVLATPPASLLPAPYDVDVKGPEAPPHGRAGI